jgi:S1-C subfamily serine protease
VLRRSIPLAILVTQFVLGAGVATWPAKGQSLEQNGATGYRGNLRAYLGVFLGDLPDVVHDGAAVARGALVGKVVPESPAAKAGLQINDVLLSFDKTNIESAAHVYRLLGELAPGAHVLIALLRGGERRTVEVVLGERQAAVDPCKRLYAEAELHQAEANKYQQQAEEERRRGNEEEARKLLASAADVAKRAAEFREGADKAISEGTASGAENCAPGSTTSRPALGLSTIPLTAQLAKFFNVPNYTGVLIAEIKPGSLAERHGLKVGDCLHSINGQPVSLPAEVNRLLNPESATATRLVVPRPAPVTEFVLVIVREGVPQTLKINQAK